MSDSSMFYFNIAINYCTGCKYSPHPWLALGACREVNRLAVSVGVSEPCVRLAR